MDVRFTRLARNQCMASSVRSDGATVVTTTTAKGGIPHDLEHLIVDRALGIKGGFWDCVWRGGEFKSVKVEASRPRHRSRSNKDAAKLAFNPLSERLGGWIGAIFCCLAASSWSPPSPLPRDDEIAALLRNPDLRQWIDPTTLELVFRELFLARQRWLALSEGEYVTYEWPTA